MFSTVNTMTQTLERLAYGWPIANPYTYAMEL